MQIPSSLSLRNMVLNTNWRSSEHLCCSETQPVMEADLGPDQGHSRLVEIIGLFFSHLNSIPTVLGVKGFQSITDLKCRNGFNEQIKADKTEDEMCSVQTVKQKPKKICFSS